VAKVQVVATAKVQVEVLEVEAGLLEISLPSLSLLPSHPLMQRSELV
jgi:hypothetical protein